MVAARELKLVQVYHISVPKVSYTHLLVFLWFTSCCGKDVSSSLLEYNTQLLVLFLSSLLLLLY